MELCVCILCVLWQFFEISTEGVIGEKLRLRQREAFARENAGVPTGSKSNWHDMKTYLVKLVVKLS